MLISIMQTAFLSFFFFFKLDSLGHDIPKMLQLFREGLEYTVEDERVIKTRIARVSCIWSFKVFSTEQN